MAELDHKDKHIFMKHQTFNTYFIFLSSLFYIFNIKFVIKESNCSRWETKLAASLFRSDMAILEKSRIAENPSARGT